jgi:hypothetical protein
MAPTVATRPQDGLTVPAAGADVPGQAGPSQWLTEPQVLAVLERISAKLDAAIGQLGTPQVQPRNMRAKPGRLDRLKSWLKSA